MDDCNKLKLLKYCQFTVIFLMQKGKFDCTQGLSNNFVHSALATYMLAWM